MLDGPYVSFIMCCLPWRSRAQIRKRVYDDKGSGSQNLNFHGSEQQKQHTEGKLHVQFMSTPHDQKLYIRAPNKTKTRTDSISLSLQERY